MHVVTLVIVIETDFCVSEASFGTACTACACACCIYIKDTISYTKAYLAVRKKCGLVQVSVQSVSYNLLPLQDYYK